MKTLFASVFFILAISLVNAQPCKLVKTGMTKSEVLKLVGTPTEVDSLGLDINPDGSRNSIVVWQYGDPAKDGNQRVEFTGDKVDGVIADGKKHDELMTAFKNGDFPKKELFERIDKLNKEACK